MMLDINDIKKLNPQRFPFQMVDRILELEPMKYAVGLKNISANELQFLGHFPDEPIMPGVLLLEAMAQVGGVVMRSAVAGTDKRVVFAKIETSRFRHQVVPGDQVIIKSEIVRVVRDSMFFFHSEGRVDGKVVCECDYATAITYSRKAK